MQIVIELQLNVDGVKNLILHKTGWKMDLFFYVWVQDEIKSLDWKIVIDRRSKLECKIKKKIQCFKKKLYCCCVFWIKLGFEPSSVGVFM